ncbi:hypothetical protein E4T47_01714 [Aureobasidium subglaciale]|nr:hypothetical protein E4T47_01714 [Aureobasidium subglaciale]
MVARAECSSEPTTRLDNIVEARNAHDNRQPNGFDEDFPEVDEANSSASDYGSSVSASYCSSIRSNIEDYYWENGRRYHAMGGGRYLLPNDDTELDREDMKHHMWTLVLEGCLHLAPVGDHPQRILDVGSGSGIWAMQAADQYPSAEVIGFDISPVQPSWVPPNLAFEIDDLEKDWLWQASSFDLVHCRFMFMSISDWPSMLAQAHHTLRPGGYIELAELDLHPAPAFEGRSGPPLVSEWFATQSSILGKKGFDMRIASKFKQILLAAGFKDVVEVVRPVPWGTWPSDRRLKAIGFWHVEQLKMGLQGITMASLTRAGWSVPEVELFLAGLRREMKDTDWQLQDQASLEVVTIVEVAAGLCCCPATAVYSRQPNLSAQALILVSLAISHSTHLAISINIHTIIMASPSRSGGTMHVAVTSPFKFLMGSSHSAPDMSVNALVDRFTTLEVKDRDEDSAKRAVRRLEAALRRAEMAREEAETEATSLRDELREQRDMAEERLREKMDLRQRLDEYEKKYEKAKERFKQQKVKHEEQLRKMQKEYMEREKLHWRQQQQLQEEVDWEKKLRADSNDLIAFLEIDHIVALQAQKDKHLELLAKQPHTTPSVQLPQESLDDFDIEIDTPKKQEDEAMAEDNDYAVEDSPEPETTQTSSNHTPVRSHSSTPIAHDSPQHTTTPPQPTTHTKQTLRVPINFNDEDDPSSTSDKENSLPLLQPPRTPNPSSRTVSAPPHHLKTPMTISCSTPASHPNIPDFLNTPIDREAALAAIRERRGRARSNGAAGMATPRRLGRDASAPPGAGSVGSRSKSRGP